MQRFIVLEKSVGQTPLECAEQWREDHPELGDVPLAYAGRLDPMASGKLLVLIGDECKRQEQYHNLDKSYQFEILFGTKSDTADVLGLLQWADEAQVSFADLRRVCSQLTGAIELPYPHFSSKTVQGKPLHTWTLEGRLDEIAIPKKQSTIYKLKPLTLRTEPAEKIYKTALKNINSIPKVTDERKALGNDFRRADVRASWKHWLEINHNKSFQIATINCTASSGTYMRTLAEVIAKELHATGLAYSIHRTHIGRYLPLPFGLGVWLKQF